MSDMVVSAVISFFGSVTIVLSSVAVVMHWREQKRRRALRKAYAARLARSRSGRSNEEQCECDSKRPAVIYDVNGWKRWCVDCGRRRP